jgi:hypothetical protein
MKNTTKDTVTIVLASQHLEALKALLDRAPLKGSEVPVFTEIARAVYSAQLSESKSEIEAEDFSG